MNRMLTQQASLKTFPCRIPDTWQSRLPTRNFRGRTPGMWHLTWLQSPARTCRRHIPGKWLLIPHRKRGSMSRPRIPDTRSMIQHQGLARMSRLHRVACHWQDDWSRLHSNSQRDRVCRRPRTIQECSICQQLACIHACCRCHRHRNIRRDMVCLKPRSQILQGKRSRRQRCSWCKPMQPVPRMCQRRSPSRPLRSLPPPPSPRTCRRRSHRKRLLQLPLRTCQHRSHCRLMLQLPPSACQRGSHHKPVPHDNLKHFAHLQHCRKHQLRSRLQQHPKQNSSCGLGLSPRSIRRNRK